MPSLISFKEASGEQMTASILGGKANALIQLFQEGFSVPDGFVITTEVFRQFLKRKNVLLDRIEDIYKKMDECLLLGDVAVRSSATVEDSSKQSFAGQFDSFLEVGRKDLPAAIMKCWESLDNPRASKYEGRSKGAREMAVIIQEMIYPQVSGVAFSIDPVKNNPNLIIIEAVAGSNKSLVDGSVTPEYYAMDKKLRILEKPSHAGQNFSDNQIIAIARMTCEVEKFFKKPVDIEWAIDKKGIYILQSRPVTTI